MAAASSWTGQRALQPLPSRSLSDKRSVANYSIPDHLVQHRNTLNKAVEDGVPLLKVAKNGKLTPRRLAFTADRRNILVTTNKIKGLVGLFKAVTRKESAPTPTVISLEAVDRIQRGSISRRFLLARHDAMVENATQVLRLFDEEDACLTVIYRKGHYLESLDLVIPNRADYEILLTVLENLVALHHEERQRYSSSLQLLHHYWVELGKEWESDMNMSEFLQLCDKLQVPLKRSALHAIFKEDCMIHERDDDKISFVHVARLLETIKRGTTAAENLPIEKLWRSLVETDPVPPTKIQKAYRQLDDEDHSMELNLKDEESISAVAFLSFLRSHQKEFRTSLEEATDLIHVLNFQSTPDDLDDQTSSSAAPLDRLTKSRFLAFLTSDANDALHPAHGRVGADDMTKPLSHYWINTSHDTYLSPVGNSLHGKSAYGKGRLDVDEQMYTRALLRGVRCLELDVWDGLDRTEPVVAQNQPLQASDKRIPLELVLRLVGHFVAQHPYTFPIILKLENHCSPKVQLKVAKLLQEQLGRALARPHADRDAGGSLPSPEVLRGKVVIIGKRPKVAAQGRKVKKDDFDEDLDSFHTAERLRSLQHIGKTQLVDDEDEEAKIVTGFDADGPIRSEDANAHRRPVQDLIQAALDEADTAEKEVDDAKSRAVRIDTQAEEQEERAVHLTQVCGLSPGEVRRRAERAAAMASGDASSVSRMSFSETFEEEKSTKDEGLEVHEVLPDIVEGSRSRYEHAAREAMDAAGREANCHALLREKEEALRMAQADLDMSKQREKAMQEKARRAASVARSNVEHAETAKERVVKLKQLLENSKDQSSTAGTVVQTALTESKISEKRAVEAEARAERAAAAAVKDRARADAETKKEELLEQQVNYLHEECLKAAEAAKSARERVEKAATLLDRVNEQLNAIESNSMFKRERQEGNFDGPYTVKYNTKIKERELCRELIKEASEEHSAAEIRRNRFQQEFEERGYQWRVQADVAAQARRTSDRSSHVAEEMAEHAEEEREAANLRHIARHRAEATVENKDFYLTSLQQQMAEAQRAVSEAASLAVKSRKEADYVTREAEKVKDHRRFIEAVEKLEWDRKQAQGEYDVARMEREKKDRVMMDEKSRLDTNSEVYQATTRDLAMETDRVRVEVFYQNEAVVAYNQALSLRAQASHATETVEAAMSKAVAKRKAADHALEWKKTQDMLVEIPVDLAKVTCFNSCRHENWDKSLSLANSHVHSFAHNVLLLLIDKDPDQERRHIHAFSKNHLIRVFPSWKAILNKPITNYDPVLPWALGCQLVSSNFQSVDENLLVADGRFRQNGSCGYVLKPPYLTDNISKTENDQKWFVQIISGHNLPKPIKKTAGAVSPLVKISVYTGSPKETRISYRTRPLNRAGLNPIWSANNKFEFAIPNPSITMIAISVWHTNDDGSEYFMGVSALPASCLREGIRSVALFDEDHTRDGQYMSACLLIKAVRRS